MKNSGSLQIRSIEPRDTDAVNLLIRQLGYERTLEGARSWIDRVAARGTEQAAFVACMDEEVCGWVEVSIEQRLQTTPFALIGGLVVKEGVRGMGVGRRLCEQAETWTRQRGLDTLRLTSRSTREAAHQFYLRAGYRQVKTSLAFEKKLPE